MFEFLSTKLHRVQKTLLGQSVIRQSNIAETLKEVQSALLEADVSLSVVKELIAAIEQKAIGQKVWDNITPAQAFIGIVHDELLSLLEKAKGVIALNYTPPVVFMMIGLQGSGKTTSSVKLAYWLKKEKKKKVLLVSCDIYRPAAQEQLKILAQQAGVDYWAEEGVIDPIKIAQGGLEIARSQLYDVIIVDTAGRQENNEVMMSELEKIQEVINPHEVLFVVDMMIGQSVIDVASSFHKKVPLSGLVLAKVDADARGGAVLSLWHNFHLPIKFCGTSEKIDGFSEFEPRSIVSQLLGCGDILALLKKAQDAEKRNDIELEKKKSKKKVDLNDFREQVQKVRKMGSLSDLMNHLPMKMTTNLRSVDEIEKEMRRTQGMIDAMTPLERRKPELIKANRKKRIAAGSGTSVQEVNRLLKQFEEAQAFMKTQKKVGNRNFLPFLEKR